MFEAYITMQVIAHFLFFLFLNSAGAEDTVKDDFGIHQLQRLVDLLTVQQCKELLVTLSHPEENIFNQLDRLSEEKNPLKLPSRITRDIAEESNCHQELMEWLQTHSQELHYDMLARALQQIGRTDIVKEMGKNINQDKTLNMQRYVEAYHEHVKHMEPPHIQAKPEQQQQKETAHHSAKKVRSLTRKDLDLVVEMKPAPPYQRHMLDPAWPLLYGFIFGFGSALFIVMPLLLIILRVTLCDS